MENTFGSRLDGGAFKENFMPELTEIAKENATFSDKQAVLGGNPPTVGTGWTMAAMFSHSTGLPLKVPVQGNSLSDFSTFFPGAISIGQILKEEGYKNYLMLGSDATFGGRRNFYTLHGDYEIYDYDVAIEKQVIPEDYKVWWGFEDEKLYSWAKEELIEISKKEEPFNFTMLTVDTHHEDGYVCSLCEEEFDDQYANVIACASRQIDDFIKWIQDQDFYENTSIVIVGDHPTMDSDFKEDINRNYTSTTYNTFINSGISVSEERLRNRDFYAFDLFPTTLASLGVEIMGDRVALGTNLFSDEDTLFVIHGKSMHEELLKKSRFYDNKFLFEK
ncbi:MAG: LTA synthase family protein [Clostridium sp.]|nr:LTA synthase family protein [Clostridium sp.]